MKAVTYNRLYEHLNLRDKDDAKSLVNIVPSWFADAIRAIPDDVFLLSEEELEKKAKATAREAKLRVSFWEEYQRVTTRNTIINISNIVGGICDHRTFQSLLKNSFMCAYILQAPIEVHVALEEIIHLGLKEMRNIMLQPVVDDVGKVDSKLCAVKHKIWQDAMDRRRGHVLKQIDLRSQNLHLHANANSTPTEQQVTAEEMEAQIRELQPPQHEKDIVSQVLHNGVRDVEEV